MLERATVAAWLDAYIKAWKSYDLQDIRQLFSENATYGYSPFKEPVKGHEAIVDLWLSNRDEPGTYDARYEPVLIEGDRAVTNGHSLYFEPDGATLKAEFSNIFLLRFDSEGRCTEYREWYMQRP